MSCGAWNCCLLSGAASFDQFIWVRLIRSSHSKLTQLNHASCRDFTGVFNGQNYRVKKEEFSNRGFGNVDTEGSSDSL